MTDALTQGNGSGPVRVQARGRVARELLAATEAGRARLIPGAGTRLIGLAAGTAPGLLARYMDHRIARAQRAANPG